MLNKSSITPAFSLTRLWARAAILAILGLSASVGFARASTSVYPVMSADGAYLSGLIAGSDFDTTAAATYFSQALRADPDNSQLMERAFIADLTDGDVESAAAIARRIIKDKPNASLPLIVLGVYDIQEKQYKAAIKTLGKAGVKSDVTARLLTAWAYAGAGQTKRAIETLDGLDQLQFKVFREYNAGLIYEYARQTSKAGQHLKAAYEADPETLRIADAWARYNDGVGKAAEAKTIYHKFDQLLPRDPVLAANLATLNAGKKLGPLVASPQEGAAEVLYGLGSAGAQQNDAIAAMVYLRLALYLAPNQGLAAVTLAEVYERLKQHEVAIAVYRLTPPRSPLRLSADIQIALITDELGQHDEAKSKLSKIVAEHPTNVDALTALGNLLRAQKNYADAVTYYTKALTQSGGVWVKSNWTLLYFRGICEERLDKWPAAEADFKQALVLFPDQPMVLNYLAYSWLDRNMNLNEAFVMLQKAAQLRPNDGYVIDSLGWAYYKLGKYKLAEQILERAVQLEPGDPTVNEHLGDAFWRNGRKLEARFQWNHARDFGADKKDLPRILNEIAHGLPDEPAKPADKPEQGTATPSKNGG